MPTVRNDAFVVCRAIGHAWYEVPDDAQWSTRRVWRHRMVLQCERCDMRRFDGVDAFGNVGHRHYEPPNGYSYPKDNVPTRADFRLMMVKPKRKRRRRDKEVHTA